ncbi:MAG: RdgB/HAM1 family non-canonical purine NTP pyrophosphatase [Alphaproteobacteria bacterium]|nr:RdgB/HAM1 family non-canonical purine NTP pyrophosphatase [Alphaproteobacteria bacterium]
MKELIFASHNQGKIVEIKALLAPFPIQVLSSDDINLPDIEETGETFYENAKLKAESIAKFTKKPCLADDSGLCVDALGGGPGVYSARYAPNRDFEKAMGMLLQEMRQSGQTSRAAHFECVLVLAYPNGESVSFEGRVDGVIAQEIKGKSGFGFDPVFVPNGFDETFAELGAQIKNKISHRARALEKFAAYIANKGL